MKSFDFAIIGGGIAGASAGYYLADHGSVAVIEGESQPGYHTTGRSAAFFAGSYGGPLVQPFTRVAKAFFENPPAGFPGKDIMTARGALYVARADQLAALDHLEKLAAGFGMTKRLTAAEVSARVPLFREGYLAGGLFEEDCYDLDVAALHQGFLRGIKRKSGEIVCDAMVSGLTRTDGRWRIETAAGEIAASIVVNAAGAWGDHVAAMAGCTPIGLEPKRRTAILFRPRDVDVDPVWPLVLDADEKFYFKPETGRILASPEDETPMPPCDVQPEMEDVAITVDRIERATTLTVPRIENKWAGLRTFAPDRAPVLGFDKDVAGFYWCVGQGGWGIQTSPGMGQFTAAMAAGADLPPAFALAGFEPGNCSPARFQ